MVLGWLTREKSSTVEGIEPNRIPVTARPQDTDAPRSQMQAPRVAIEHHSDALLGRYLRRMQMIYSGYAREQVLS